jgi:hypothetical protein
VKPVLLVALVLSFASPKAASARRAAGVTLPDSVDIDGKRLALNGMGVHEVTLFGVDVYVAGLYLERKMSNSMAVLSDHGTKHMIIRFKRDVDRSDLLERVRDELRPTLRRQRAGVRAELNRILGTLRAVRSGHTLTLTMKKTGWIEVRQNGGLRARSKNPALASYLLATWVGPRPLSSDLKRNLLGRR